MRLIPIVLMAVFLPQTALSPAHKRDNDVAKSTRKVMMNSIPTATPGGAGATIISPPTWGFASKGGDKVTLWLDSEWEIRAARGERDCVPMVLHLELEKRDFKEEYKWNKVFSWSRPAPGPGVYRDSRVREESPGMYRVRLSIVQESNGESWGQSERNFPLAIED